MTDKNARLTLISVQRDGGERETVRQNFLCSYRKIGGEAWSVKYDDPENGGSAVTIRISRSRAEILRSGRQSGLKMRIEPGRQTNSAVKTPYGEMNIPIMGISVACGFDERGGKAEITYSNGTEITLKMKITAIR